MSTHDYVIDNGTGAAVRSDINNALAAIVTLNSVSGTPGTTYAYQIFHDTAASQGLKQRDGSNANSNGLLLYRPLVRDGIYDPANVTLEMIRFTGVASAVNELTVTNAVTGSAPILSATGGDANINLTLTPKGTGSVFVPAGTATNPSISVSTDTNTGLFFSAADQLSLVTGGTSRLVVTSTSVFVPAGTATNPSVSISTDTNTGIYFPAADTIGLVCGGIEEFRVDGDGQLWNTVNSEVGTDYTTLYKGYFCRAWVNFNGVTPAVRASGNVSSVTDNGTGDYTVNFTTAMPDTNYAAAGMVGDAGVANSIRGVMVSSASAPTTSALRVVTGTETGSTDVVRLFIAVLR